MEITSIRQHIIENISLLSEYEMRPMVRKINQRLLSTYCGMYVSEEGTIPNTPIKLRMEDTDIKGLMKELDMQINRYFPDRKTAIEHAKLSSLFNSYYFRHRQGDEYYIPKDYYHSSLLYCLKYVITGEFDEDYGQVNRIYDAHPEMKSDAYDVVLSELNNIRLKHFKNGRIDIKGLTDSQKEKLLSLEKTINSIPRY